MMKSLLLQTTARLMTTRLGKNRHPRRRNKLRGKKSRAEFQRITKQNVRTRRLTQREAKKATWQHLHLSIARLAAAIPVSNVDTLPGWIRKASRSHSLCFANGVVCCLNCSLIACTPRPRLRNVCKGNSARGSDRDGKRMLLGKLPIAMEEWPVTSRNPPCRVRWNCRCAEIGFRQGFVNSELSPGTFAKFRPAPPGGLNSTKSGLNEKEDI